MAFEIFFRRRAPPPDDSGGAWRWGPYAAFPAEDFQRACRMHGHTHEVTVMKDGAKVEGLMAKVGRLTLANKELRSLLGRAYAGEDVHRSKEWMKRAKGALE